MTPRDPDLDRLLARYWDGTLAADEQAALNARLESDPEARRWFREYCLQAVVAGEVGVTAEPAKAPAVPHATGLPSGRGRLTRRTVLGFGLGTAAGIAAGAILHTLWNQSPLTAVQPRGVRLTWTRGQVFRLDSNTEPLQAGAFIPAGEGVVTVGPTSSAVVELPDNSTLCLSADTVLSVSEGGGRAILHRGGVTADLRPSADDPPAMTVGTPQVSLTTGGGAEVDLSCGGRVTEVLVQRGRVAVADREGAVTEVRDGELLTLDAYNGLSLRPTPILTDNFVLEFTERLPEGWRVGHREEANTGVVIAPELYYDPYHAAKLYQIRSHNPWTRGMVRLFPDSVVTARYRADRSADGQVVLVVRRPRSAFKEHGCLTWDRRFEMCGRGEWRTIRVRAADMLDNKEGPRFPPPWVAVLLIFNTYTEDIGLRVADFRVTRPGSA